MKNLFVTIVLDRSGSMSSNVVETVGALNAYLDSIRADKDVSYRLRLMQFDSQDQTILREGMIGDIAPINVDEFKPRGMTPLYDAIGNAVVHADTLPRRDSEGTALVILTDGLENASRHYHSEQIKGMLDQRKRDWNWLVLYLGADHDAFTASGALGIHVNHTLQFNKGNADAHRHSMAAVARSTGAYGMTGDAGPSGATMFSDDERKLAKGDDKKTTGANP